MSDIQELIKSGTDVIKSLNKARHVHNTAVLALAKAEQNLTLTGALAENRAIVAAGGEKALGSNADARKRALIIALGHDETYQGAQAFTMQALGDARLAQAQVAALEDTLGLLKASLYTNARQD